MADDQSRYDGEYDKGTFKSLSQEDKETITNPSILTDQYDLRRTWELLHKVNARSNLLSDWIKHLPAGYDRVLRVEDRDWLWTRMSDVIPDALQTESGGRIVSRLALHSMHVCRIRANALGIERMSDYVRTKIHVNDVKEVWTLNDSDEYFSVSKTKGDYDFCYSSEHSIVLNAVLIDKDNYGSGNDSHTPDSLRYTLEKWRTGAWNTYMKQNVTLLHYATDLVLHLHSRYGCTKPLSSLPCYTDDFSWTPGTIFVPDELRNEIDSLLMDIPHSHNATFLRNYYQVTSEYILRSLHEKISKDILRMKREGDSRCVIQ